MPRPLFAYVPNRALQQFTRVRRTSGGTKDSYGDATFTENQTAGFRGMFQIAGKPNQTVTIAGNEVRYDAIAYMGATVTVGEDDVLLFGSSSATTVSTRYRVNGVVTVYDGSVIDHKQVFVSQEVR